MNEPKINIVEANSFKEAYDLAPEEFKEQIEECALDYYTDKIEKLIASFNLEDVTFIVNAIRCALVSLECFYQEDLSWPISFCRKKCCRL